MINPIPSPKSQSLWNKVSLGLEMTKWARLGGQQISGILLPAPPQLWNYKHAPTFLLGLSNRSQVLMMVWQVFFPLSHSFPALFWIFISLLECMILLPWQCHGLETATINLPLSSGLPALSLRFFSCLRSLLFCNFFYFVRFEYPLII